jgi:ankyrin repeat protein
MASKQISKLKAAIAEGDLSACRALIDADRDLARDWRAIMEAALFVDLELIRLCVSAGADPNAVSQSEARHRPLHRVIEVKKSVRQRGDRVDAVELLLAAGAEVDALGCWYDGRPLETAARGSDATVATVLCRRGARRDVFAGALLGDPELVGRELDRDPALAAQPGPSGAGALHLLCASRLGRTHTLSLAEQLLDHGATADAVAVMRHGRFPVLHFACWGGEADLQLLALLVARGAKPDDGLYEALWAGDFGAAAALVALGASPDGWSHVGKRPLLHDMIQWGRNNAALWLLARGADPNAPDSNGWTALHYAASRGAKAAFVDKLLEAGADPSRQSPDGLNAAALGAQTGDSRGKPRGAPA